MNNKRNFVSASVCNRPYALLRVRTHNMHEYSRTSLVLTSFVRWALKLRQHIQTYDDMYERTCVYT